MWLELELSSVHIHTQRFRLGRWWRSTTRRRIRTSMKTEPFITWATHGVAKATITTSSASHRVRFPFIFWAFSIFRNLFSFMLEGARNGESVDFGGASIVASLPARNQLAPSYYHSFAMTDRFFVFAEMSMIMDIPKMATMNLHRQPFYKLMKFNADQKVRAIIGWIRAMFARRIFMPVFSFSFQSSNLRLF